MNKQPQIEITVYERRHGYKNQVQKNVKWLQAMIPVIMHTHAMITDEFHLAPLGKAVSLCLN